MLGRLLTLTAVAGAIAAGAAAPAAADSPVLAVDIIATHTVVWDYVDGDPANECDSWIKGSGTQEIRIHSLKRAKVRLERAFGSTLLSGWGGSRSTFDGTISRSGRWKANVPPSTPACTGCGPNSEMGPCAPPKDPPKPPQFKCGTRDLKGPVATVGYVEGKGIPSIDRGLTVKVWARTDDRVFDNCPPDLRGQPSAARLRTPWPDWETLPKQDLARLTRLQVGDSVTAEVTRQRTAVDRDGTTKKGDSCLKLPDDKTGYSECAVTEYAVTFTRLR